MYSLCSYPSWRVGWCPGALIHANQRFSEATIDFVLPCWSLATHIRVFARRSVRIRKTLKTTNYLLPFTSTTVRHRFALVTSKWVHPSATYPRIAYTVSHAPLINRERVVLVQKVKRAHVEWRIVQYVIVIYDVTSRLTRPEAGLTG